MLHWTPEPGLDLLEAMGVSTCMARRAKQFEFDERFLKKPGDAFGGSLLKGNPKRARPLESKLPIHLTLRAKDSVMRTGKNFAVVNAQVYATAKKYGVSIYRYANVGNHLHLVIKLSRRHRWAPFIRELTGRIAQLMRATQGFWLYRPHTRIVRGWKKAFQIAKEYVYLNELEAQGWIKRSETKALKDLRAIFADG